MATFDCAPMFRSTIGFDHSPTFCPTPLSASTTGISPPSLASDIALYRLGRRWALFAKIPRFFRRAIGYRTHSCLDGTRWRAR